MANLHSALRWVMLELSGVKIFQDVWRSLSFHYVWSNPTSARNTDNILLQLGYPIYHLIFEFGFDKDFRYVDGKQIPKLAERASVKCPNRSLWFLVMVG